MKSALLMIGVAVAVQLAGETDSAAYKLEPISQVFEPTGSKATRSFELVNSGAERVALTISFATLERDGSYVETNRDADDEFLAYPAQLVLAPGARQTVRVTWLGSPQPAHELAYRIVVTQVPIEAVDRAAAPDVQPAGKVRVLLNYRGTLFIRPPTATPRVALETAASLADPTQGAALAITLANTGTGIGRIKSCTVRLAPAAGGAAVELSARELEPLRNTRVLARSKRRYLVAWPPGLPAGPVKVSGRCSVEP